MKQFGKLLFLFFFLGIASGAEEGERLLTRVA